jgi:hypothetical protein
MTAASIQGIAIQPLALAEGSSRTIRLLFYLAAAEDEAGWVRIAKFSVKLLRKLLPKMSRIIAAVGLAQGRVQAMWRRAFAEVG